MRFMLGAVAAVAAQGAAAQTAQTIDPARAVAQPLLWQASAGAGFTRIDGAGDQPFAAVGVRRDFDTAHVRLSGTWSESKRDERIALGQLAARTASVTAAGGWRRGALALDAWVTGGDRAFKDVLVETIPPTTTNRRKASGSLLALGAGAALEVPLRGSWTLGPYGWGEWGRVTTEAIERDPSGAETFRERLVESGFTGAAGVSLDVAVAPGRAGLFASAGMVGATNTSTLSQIDPGLPVGGPAARGEGGDVWAELALGGAARLGERLTLVAAVTRTAGLEGGDYTQGALQLRLGF